MTGSMAVYFLRPLFVTLVLELAVSVLLGIRKRNDVIVIALMNLLTNPLLNAALLYLAVHFPYHAYRYAIYGMEGLVWLIEGMVIRRFLEQVKHPLLLSLCLNGVSYCLGGMILRFVF